MVSNRDMMKLELCFKLFILVVKFKVVEIVHMVQIKVVGVQGWNCLQPVQVVRGEVALEAAPELSQFQKRFLTKMFPTNKNAQTCKLCLLWQR